MHKFPVQSQNSVQKVAKNTRTKTELEEPYKAAMITINYICYMWPRFDEKNYNVALKMAELFSR